MRFVLPLAAAMVGLAFAACSSSQAEDAPAPDDAGVDVVWRPHADAAADVTRPPPGPSHPTPRCASAKPAAAAFAVPDDSLTSDGGAPLEGGASGTDAGAPDAANAVDAGDASVDGGAMITTAIRPLRVPTVGGPVLAMPHWVPVFFQDTDDLLDLTDFMGSVGCTDYWHAITADYGVGEGVSGAAAVIPEDGPAKITDEQLSKWLVKQVKAGLVEKPGPGTLYVVFVPSGTTVTQASGSSCLSFDGYHAETNIDGAEVPYAVVARCGDLDQATGTASHELIEAATDPLPMTRPAFSSPSDADFVWALAAGGEVGDLCTFIDGAFFTPDGYPYAVQRSFSNKASLAGHDPCVPSSQPYFYAAPSLESSVVCTDCGGVTTTGVEVPAGTSKSVEVLLGADDASVRAMQVTVLAGKDLHLANASSGTGSSFALDRRAGVPGDRLRLTITAASNASGSDVFAVVATYQGRAQYWYGLVTH